MKSIFTGSRDSPPATSGVADLMTSPPSSSFCCSGLCDTRLNGNANPVGPCHTDGHDAKLDPRHPPEERPSVHTVTVPDAAINFEFGKSTLLPTAETFLLEVIRHYANICGPGGQEVEAFVIEGHTDDLVMIYAT